MIKIKNVDIIHINDYRTGKMNGSKGDFSRISYGDEVRFKRAFDGRTFDERSIMNMLMKISGNVFMVTTDNKQIRLSISDGAITSLEVE
nr:MAG TPA: hypothetical protein [Caudoviricetes sp.]